MLMKMAVRNNRERYSIQIIEIDSMSINISHLDAFLGEGAFSWVYSLKNTPYAAKISKFNDKDLEKEFALLESLGKNNPALFPQVVATGTMMLPDGQAPANYMMMERLGVSLQDFLIFRGELSLPTILQIGRQLLGQIGALMQNGIVHNDIKPTNILFGMGQKRKAVFFVDYGMAATANCETKCVFRGNLAFAASRKLRGNIEYDLRNDLQSLIYVLVWILRNGDLPWQQRQQGVTSLPERATQILALRKRIKEDYLKIDLKQSDKRSVLIRKLILLSGQYGLTACELFAHLQGML